MKLEFKPKSKNFKKKVTESFNRQKFMELINAELVEVKPGYCEIHIPYNINLTQQHGYFHAGIISTIADNASGYAGFSLMEENSSILTVEFKLNLISAAKGELLIAKSNVLKSGRILTICRSEVYIVNNGIKKLCAASQTTLIELKNKSDSGNN
jgi:uncharacterized protein (TIGR00369 family)